MWRLKLPGVELGGWPERGEAGVGPSPTPAPTCHRAARVSHTAGGQAQRCAAHGAQAWVARAGGAGVCGRTRALAEEAGGLSAGGRAGWVDKLVLPAAGAACCRMLRAAACCARAGAHLPPIHLPRPCPRAPQLAYILGRHGLALNLEDGPAAVADDDLREHLVAIIRFGGPWEERAGGSKMRAKDSSGG